MECEPVAGGHDWNLGNPGITPSSVSDSSRNLQWPKWIAIHQVWKVGLNLYILLLPYIFPLQAFLLLLLVKILNWFQGCATGV